MPNHNMPDEAEALKKELTLLNKTHPENWMKIKAIAEAYLSGELIRKAGLPTEDQMEALIKSGIIGNLAAGLDIDYTANEIAHAIHTRLERNP